MEQWKQYRLENFMQFNPAISLKKETVAKKIAMENLIPFSREIASWSDEPYNGGTKFQNGDTIMARITPCLENGKHAYVSILSENEVAFGSTEYIVMRGIPNISDNMFVYYLSLCPIFKNVAISSMVGSSGRQRAQVDVLKNLELNLPSITEQKRIAGFLSSLDDKIELNRRINDNLEQQAQALFKSWFVDFEPFKDGQFVDSELGMIPKGWRVGNIFDVANIYDFLRKPLSSAQREQMDKIYPYYGATSCMDYVDNFIFDGIFALIGEDGSVTRENGLPFVQYVWGKFWVNNHAHILQGKNGFSTEMIYTLLTITNIRHLVTGAVQAKLSQSNMNKIYLPIPPNGLIAKLRVLFDEIFKLKRLLCDEIDKLTTLRDSLLPRLMSGELKINDLNC